MIRMPEKAGNIVYGAMLIVLTCTLAASFLIDSNGCFPGMEQEVSWAVTGAMFGFGLVLAVAVLIFVPVLMRKGVAVFAIVVYVTLGMPAFL
jgi:hypothetical protein